MPWLDFGFGIANLAGALIVLDRNRHAVGQSLPPIVGWAGVACLRWSFGSEDAALARGRGAVAAHGVIGVIPWFGDVVLIVKNLRTAGVRWERADLVHLVAPAIGIQPAWDTSLLVSGMRPPEWRPFFADLPPETYLDFPSPASLTSPPGPA